MTKAAIDAILRDRRILLSINALLFILLFFALLLFIRDIVSMHFTLKTDALKPAGKIQQFTPKPVFFDYAVILKRNPFGFSGGELKQLSASTGTPSVSESDILLIGTVAGRKDASYGIFSDKSGQQDVFRVGQNVFGLGKLRSVEKNRVFVDADHKNVEIKLTDIATVREIKAPSAAGPGGFGRKTGDSAYLLDQQRIQQALEKPDQIMTDARFVPNFVEGRQQGFVLREVKPGGIYQSLGLQNGDVLVKINDFNISNPETALQAVTALRGIDRAQLDIIRNGSKITMTYQIR